MPAWQPGAGWPSTGLPSSGSGVTTVSDLPFGFQPPGDNERRTRRRRPGRPVRHVRRRGRQDMSAAFHRFADLMSWSGGPVNWDLARDVAAGVGRRVRSHRRPGPDPGRRRGPAARRPVAGRRRPRCPTGIRTTRGLEPRRLGPGDAARVVRAGGPGGRESRRRALGLVRARRRAGSAAAGDAGDGGRARGCSARSAARCSAARSARPWACSPARCRLDRDRAAARARRRRRAAPDQRRRVRRGHRRARGRGAALPRPARGRPPAPVRATCRGCARTCSALVEEYARGISVDMSASSRRSRARPGQPAGHPGSPAGGLFEPQATPAQQAALERLETALALVEGWVDAVVDAAASARLPGAGGPSRDCAGAGPPAARPSRRSRPWSGSSCGPAGCARPPRCGRAEGARGIDGRDAVWAHPELHAGHRRPRRPGGLRVARQRPARPVLARRPRRLRRPHRAVGRRAVRAARRRRLRDRTRSLGPTL